MVDKENTAHKYQHKAEHIRKTFDERIESYPNHLSPLIGISVINVRGIELVDFVIFTRESLNHAVAGDVLLSIGVHARKLLTQLSVHGADLLTKLHNDNKDKRRNRKHRKRQLPVKHAQVNRRRKIQHKRLDDVTDNPRNHMSASVKVTGNSRHQIARPVSGVELHVLSLYLVIK